MPYIWEIAIYYCIVFAISYLIKKYGRKELAKKTKKFIKEKYKILLVVIIIICLIFIVINILPKNLKIYFIDVGQGDGCLIVTPKNKKILIDRRWLRSI